MERLVGRAGYACPALRLRLRPARMQQWSMPAPPAAPARIDHVRMWTLFLRGCTAIEALKLRYSWGSRRIRGQNTVLAVQHPAEPKQLIINQQRSQKINPAGLQQW